MNFRLVLRQLGVVCWLLGVAMIFSLPWAFAATTPKEQDGFWGLVISIGICAAVGLLLRRFGADQRRATMFRKEAMAVVGLSWLLATVLGGLPFWFSGTERGWQVPPAEGVAGVPLELSWYETMADWMFESQSGFSTTGATVLTAIEDERLVPRCILFWRSTTHFLGGLGIIVLFVAILGLGSAGKALMRAEMPGPSKEGTQARMQETAITFAIIYGVLNAILAAILMFEGMNAFDAICHAFGTMATGGFSTKDASLGWYGKHGFNGELIEYTVTVFMIIAGTNFTLIYLFVIRRFDAVWRDPEWRVYLGIIALVTVALVSVGVVGYADFAQDGELSRAQEIREAVRFTLFQVVSVITTTGFGTHDFNAWNDFARCLLFVLMFVGGCAGSTGGGMKVIRHILFAKILWLEIEKAYHPTVVRPLRLGGEVIGDPELYRNILVYFGLVLGVFVASWLFIVALEPNATWIDGDHPIENKMMDSASAVVATLNNIGPGLGLVGATQNYASFSWYTKLLFVILMMLGRLEFFVILVWFVPGFWRTGVRGA